MVLRRKKGEDVASDGEYADASDVASSHQLKKAKLNEKNGKKKEMKRKVGWYIIRYVLVCSCLECGILNFIIT
jgi:hypothetical protein